MDTLTQGSAFLTPDELRQKIASLDPAYARMMLPPESKPVAQRAPSPGAVAPVEAPEPLVEITPEEALLRIRSARETGEAGEAPVADPVLGRSVEDLVADKWFNPLLYARQFPDSMKLPGMQEAMEEVYERKQAAIDQNPLKALPDPRDLSWDGVKDTAGMFLTGGFQFLKAHLKGSLGLSTPEEYRRSVATSAAALETAGLNSVDLLRDARKNPIFVPQQAAARMAQRAVETPEQRQKRISQQFSEDMGWAQVMEEAAQGKGPVTGSAAGRVVGEVITGGGFRGAAKTALGVLAGDEKALEAPGKWVRDGEIELNPEEVMGGAAVLDPINFVPVGAGIGVFTRAGKVLARGPLKGLVRFAERNGLTVRNLPTVHGVTGKAAAAVVGGLEKGAGAWASQQAIRSAAGAGLGFLAGGPVGAMAGLAAEPFTRPALKAIQSAATRFSKGRGLLFGAYDALLRKPVTGATHGLVASYPIAALTTDPEKQRAIISGGIGLGAVGGLLGGAGAAVTRTGEWTGAKLANRLYGDVAREPVQKFSYGTDAALDAAHQKGQARQAQVDRQSGMSHENVIDVLRNRMRYVREADGSLVRVEIYNLAEPDFLAYAGEQAAGAVPRPVLDSNGQPVYRVFLNADASRSARQAIFHEPGHVVTRMLEQLYPEQHKKLMDELNRLDPEALGAFKALYEARRKADLRSQDPNISAEDLEARATLSPEGVYDEAAAELLGAVLRGHSLDGLPSSLVTRAMETVGAFLEGTGIYRPGPGGTETAVGTTLGFTPGFRIGQVGREFLRASGVEGGKGAEGAPPTVRPTSTPPPLPTAPPSTPPPLPLAGVTPTAAPGGFGTVPPAIRRTPPAGGATKRGNLYTDRKGQGLMEADWWSDSSWDEALDVVERSNLPPEQKEIFRRIYDYRKTAAGPDLPPIEIDYESVKQTVGTGKPPKRAGRRTDQQIAYLEEAMGRLPEETRELFQKIFLPYRVIIRNRDGALNVNLMAMSPDKVLGNALLALRDAHAKGRSDLVPYENSNGQFTQAGAKQFADDLAVYSSNQAHGYAGSGDPVTIPAGYEGMLPEVDPTYRPQPLSRDRADFVNLSMGIEPPRTGRKVQQGINPKTGKRIETPRNIEAARLAAAQGRPLAEFPLAEGRVFKFKGEEIPIYETNPLRQQFTELGIELDRLLAEVTEEINLENIKGTPAPRPSIRFRQPSTGLVTAGLLPRGPEAIPAVRDMTVADIYAMRGRFTEEAARLGRSLREFPEAQLELEALMPPLEEAIQAKMQGPEKDLQTAVDLATKRQFIRETLETARDEGSMKGIFEEQPALYVDTEGIRYSKPLAGDIEAMKQPDGPSGTTINSDGTPYQVPEGAKLDIVTLASENMPLADLTPERIAQVVAEKGWEPVLTDQNTKLGVFKFAGPDGTPMVSVDLNVLVDQKHRANTVTFAKANNQISAFDLVTFEEIPAGGTGDTVLKEIPDLVNAVGKLTQGEPVSVATVGAKKAPSGALSVTKTVSPPETAAEGAAFLPRDEEYLRAVKEGDLETARRLVTAAAEASGLPIIPAETEAYVTRTGPAPKKTVKAYKLFQTKPSRPGELFPLFVGASTPVPVGAWLDAKAGPPAPPSKTGKPKVRSTLGRLAYRPGWHAGDLPYASHIGVKQDGKVTFRRPEEVWAEVEMAADVDYQPEANRNGTDPATGEFKPALAEIKRVPEDGIYRYKTQPTMTGNWLVGGAMKVNRILSEAEVNTILKEEGVKPMAWKGGPLDLAKKKLTTEPLRTAAKLDVPVTRDDQGNVIPLSERFNPEREDVRYLPTLDELPEGHPLRERLKDSSVREAVFHLTRARNLIPGKEFYTHRHLGMHFGPPEVLQTILSDLPVESQAIGTRTIPAYLDAKRPYRLPDMGSWSLFTLADAAESGNQQATRLMRWIEEDYDKKLIKNQPDPAEFSFQEALERMDDTGTVQEVLKRRGYDSIEYRDRFEGVRDADTGELLGLPEIQTRIKAARDEGADWLPVFLSDNIFFDQINANPEWSYAVFDAEQVVSPFGEGGSFMPTMGEGRRAVRLADGSIETVKPRELDWQFEERLTKAGKDLKKAEWGEVDAEGAFRTNDELAEMREPRPWETPEPEIPPARNEEGELQTVVGKPLDLVHLSSREDLRVLDPRKMGKGRASTIDMRGLPKTFFFEKGSPLAGDEPTFPGGESRYTARVSGKTIYDATGADPQRWRSTADRVAADQRLIDAGYSGVRVETEDGRRVVIMFERVPVKLGGKFKGGPVVFLPTSVDSSVMQIVDTMAKLSPAGLTPEFLTGVERAFNLADLEDALVARAEEHPEALRVQIQRDKDGNISWKKGGVTPQVVGVTYDFENQALMKRLRKEMGAKNEDAILDAIAELGAKHYEEAKNLPAVVEGLKWYSEARQLLKEKFGDDMDLFAQLLAATSPQQPPIPNFLDAFELYTRYRDGELDAALRRYGELLDKWDALEEPRQGETKKAAQARVREYWTGVADEIAREIGEEVKVNKRDLQTWLMDKEGILPRRTGTGSKFGVSSRAALDVLAGKWLERAGGKKTRQFYGNLVGSSFGATVDVWASRWLHRLLNEGETNKRWRIEPLTEMGVQPKDFDFAQKVFKRIADREDMTPDSLQAILWFWEKDTWDKRGWTKGAGAQRQSFIPLLKRVQVTPEGKRVLTAEDVRAVELEAEMARHRKPARLRKKQPDVNQLDLGLKTD